MHVETYNQLLLLLLVSLFLSHTAFLLCLEEQGAAGVCSGLAPEGRPPAYIHQQGRRIRPAPQRIDQLAANCVEPPGDTAILHRAGQVLALVYILLGVCIVYTYT